jgi:MFS family permease
VGILLVMVIKVIASVFAFPICAILVMQGSPSREVLGTVNGANQALASLGRAIGPAIAGIIYSRSLENEKPWIVWRYALGMVALAVWIGAWFLSDEVQLPNPRERYTQLEPLEQAAEELLGQGRA